MYTNKSIQVKRHNSKNGGGLRVEGVIKVKELDLHSGMGDNTQELF